MLAGWHFAPLLSKNVTHCPRRFMNGSAVEARLAVLSRLNCLHMSDAVVKRCFFCLFVCLVAFERPRHEWYDFNRLFGRIFLSRSNTEFRPFPLRSPPRRSTTWSGPGPAAGRDQPFPPHRVAFAQRNIFLSRELVKTGGVLLERHCISALLIWIAKEPPQLVKDAYKFISDDELVSFLFAAEVSEHGCQKCSRRPFWFHLLKVISL